MDTFALFDGDETPEAPETGFGEFGLRRLIGDLGGECDGASMKLD